MLHLLRSNVGLRLLLNTPDKLSADVAQLDKAWQPFLLARANALHQETERFQRLVAEALCAREQQLDNLHS